MPCAADAGIASKYDLALCSAQACCSTCEACISEATWNAEVLLKLQHAQDLYAECSAMEDVNPDSAEAGKAAKLLAQSLDIRIALLHPHNQVLGATRHALALACHARGQLHESVRHSRASLAVAQSNFGEGSTNAAFQAVKLSVLLQELARKEDASGDDAMRQEADVLMQNAMQVLQLHFGPLAADTSYIGV